MPMSFWAVVSAHAAELQRRQNETATDNAPNHEQSFDRERRDRTKIQATASIQNIASNTAESRLAGARQGGS